TKFSMTPPSTTSPLGRKWDFSLLDGNNTISFSAYDGPFGPDSDSGTVVLDYTHSEVRISLLAANIINASLKPGTILKNFVVSTESVVQLDSTLPLGRAYVPPDSSEDGAIAPATTTYKVGTPS